MALGALGCSSVLPCRSRSARSRPISFLGIIAFLSCWLCLHPFFSQPPDGGAGGGCGGGRDAGEDAEAQPVPVSSKGANNQVGAERIRSNDSKNDHIEKLMLILTKIQHSVASIDKSLKTIVRHQVILDNRLTTMENLMATNQGPSTAPVLIDTPANKDAVNRMKGLLGSMHSIADKLFLFCTSVFFWLLSSVSTPNSSALNSSAPNCSAPKAGQNFEDHRMQSLILGSLILLYISVYTLLLASRFKDSESIDGVLFKIYMWLWLLVFLGLSSQLFMIVHIFAHTPKYVTLSLGILLSISSVAFWFWGLYKDQEKILEELKKGCVPENGVLPENPVAEAAFVQGLDRANSYTVQISGPSVIPAYGLSN